MAPAPSLRHQSQHLAQYRARVPWTALSTAGLEHHAQCFMAEFPEFPDGSVDPGDIHGAGGGAPRNGKGGGGGLPLPPLDR